MLRLGPIKHWDLYREYCVLITLIYVPDMPTTVGGLTLIPTPSIDTFFYRKFDEKLVVRTQPSFVSRVFDFENRVPSRLTIDRSHFARTGVVRADISSAPAVTSDKLTRSRTVTAIVVISIELVLRRRRRLL